MMFHRVLLALLCVVLTQSIADSARAEDPLTLRYQFEKGTPQVARSKTDNKTTQTINGMNIETTISQTAISSRHVEGIGADGTIKVRVKNERLKSQASVGGAGEYEFDSQKPDRDKSSALGTALTPLYERLVGSELQLEVTPRGEVKSLTGYYQLVDDLIKANPVTAQFAGGGSDNAAKLGEQGQWIIFPEKPIKRGEKWEIPLEMDLPGMGTIKGKGTTTLLMLETRGTQQIAKFSTTADVSFDLNLEVNGAKVTGKVTTSNSSGSAEFNVTTGRMLKQNNELTLTGQLSVEVNNMTIPVQVNQTITTEHETLDKLPD